MDGISAFGGVLLRRIPQKGIMLPPSVGVLMFLRVIFFFLVAERPGTMYNCLLVSDAA